MWRQCKIRSISCFLSYFKLTSISVLPGKQQQLCVCQMVFFVSIIPSTFINRSVVRVSLCSSPSSFLLPCSLSSSQYRLMDLWFIHCNLLVWFILMLRLPQIWSVRAVFKLFPFIRPLYSLNTSNFSRTRCSRLILCFPCPGPGISHFSKKSWFC